MSKITAHGSLHAYEPIVAIRHFEKPSRAAFFNVTRGVRPRSPQASRADISKD
jgi:hypothetical protein